STTGPHQHNNDKPSDSAKAQSDVSPIQHIVAENTAPNDDTAEDDANWNLGNPTAFSFRDDDPGVESPASAGTLGTQNKVVDESSSTPSTDVLPSGLSCGDESVGV